MIINYFKIAWRSLWKHKAYSLINVIGLSIGLTSCLIVATVVIDELSYDHQWKKADDIYRVLSIGTDIKGEEPQPVAFSGFGPSIKKDLPEVADYCRMSVGKERLQLGNFKEGIAFQALDAEITIWNMLDFKVIEGNPQKFVKGYVNLIITERISKQYFPKQSPIGKMITTIPEYGKAGHYLITGVIKDIPQNTHLRADIITLGEYKASDNGLPQKDKGYYFCPQYILLKHGTSIKAFTSKANKWYVQQEKTKKPDEIFKFQPIKDVYLKSDFNAVQPIHSNMRTVYIFSGIAALLLIIACINFVNLTISRVFKNAKETGIRKVLGAGKLQLIIRFLSESLIFFILSFILAVIGYPVLLKPVEAYLGHPLVLNLFNNSFLIIAICSVFVISFLTGIYPAWFLSRPQPIVIIRNKLATGVQLNFLKKGLVVGQFVISITIIIITFIVHSQLTFMSNKDLGFDKNNLLNISYTSWGTQGAAFRQSIKQLAGVENVSQSEWCPTDGPGGMSREISIPGRKEKVNIYYIEGDADLPATLKLKIKSGRLFNAQFTSDAMDADSSMSGTSAESKALMKSQSYLVTNYTAGLLGLKVNAPIANIEGIPVGIVEDFNSESLHSKLQPTIINALTNFKGSNMLVRIKPGYEKRILENIDRSYKSFYPERHFGFDWVNELVEQQYKTEYKLQQLFTCFSMLIVFLASLGLFGLVSFSAEQRVKEIGVRKVLGAGVGNIVTLISKDYLGLVSLAIIIASPIAWYAMNKWLQDFAYRIHIQWWVFVLSGILALIIAFITISFQSIKAALANPVESLRSE